MRNRILLISFFSFSLFILFESCSSEEQINYQRYYVNGKGLYEQHCQNCHAKDGTGLKSLYPPLTDTSYIQSNKNQLSCIIKYGLNTKIEIAGKEYHAEMPANAQLSDIDIAQLIVYIGNSFGNKIGYYDASEANADLKNCKF
ncbi:c-type cytochrome [Daejeonella oryzae]|uniref:c-type cytochrome n=1 Tax=Daejeonella oryzae TaxID=1122943 RepID=UPI000479AA24|nr:cytochrome c [Daejeonella oryzae]